ncbi:serine-threonine phosophatase 2C [Babesia caballi]|uniref:Serine-threonine phosophatase 2C n=1 Tax=Babesia caballi TaxID=5871 RepID=A0AAV4LZK0_BABCB|nr:serine-threonine phosophatase 2C [Babesia caballi]
MATEALASVENDGEHSLPYVELTQPINCANFGPFSVSAHTDIGHRKTQEDRFVVVPSLGSNGNHVAFFGIFDGTVGRRRFGHTAAGAGHFASDTIQKIIVRHLVCTDVWDALMKQLEEEDDGTTIPALAVLALSKMYANADAELLDLCRKEENHYSSCTSVTVLIVNDYIVVAHLGDSRVSLCYEEGGQTAARFITADHKPHLPEERQRIVAAGGSVQYLTSHHNKPFLRGGDFLARKAKGEQPMQIQYSRAFGGKDLKMFGLSSEPDISVFRRTSQHKGLILASDGLWDTRECHQAFSNVLYARSKGILASEVFSPLAGKNPSRYLVETTLKENRCKAHRSDNITAVAVAAVNSDLESRAESRAHAAAAFTPSSLPLYPLDFQVPVRVRVCRPAAGQLAGFPADSRGRQLLGAVSPRSSVWHCGAATTAPATSPGRSRSYRTTQVRQPPLPLTPRRRLDQAGGTALLFARPWRRLTSASGRTAASRPPRPAVPCCCRTCGSASPTRTGAEDGAGPGVPAPAEPAGAQQQLGEGEERWVARLGALYTCRRRAEAACPAEGKPRPAQRERAPPPACARGSKAAVRLRSFGQRPHRRGPAVRGGPRSPWVRGPPPNLPPGQARRPHEHRRPARRRLYRRGRDAHLPQPAPTPHLLRRRAAQLPVQGDFDRGQGRRGRERLHGRDAQRPNNAPQAAGKYITFRYHPAQNDVVYHVTVHCTVPGAERRLTGTTKFVYHQRHAARSQPLPARSDSAPAEAQAPISAGSETYTLNVQVGEAEYLTCTLPDGVDPASAARQFLSQHKLKAVLLDGLVSALQQLRSSGVTIRSVDVADLL